MEPSVWREFSREEFHVVLMEGDWSRFESRAWGCLSASWCLLDCAEHSRERDLGRRKSPQRPDGAT